MQKSAANDWCVQSVFVPLPRGGKAKPLAFTVAPVRPLSVKQSRNFPTEQVSPGRGQSAFVEQPRNVSTGPQNCSNGPAAHVPSLPPSDEQVESSHWFGVVAAPGTVHAPPGHSDATVQAAPLLPPPTQRRPPQIGPIGPAGSGQSALSSQGSALPLLQVSQKHLRCVKPGARQFGLAAESVFDLVPVVFVRSIGSVAINAPPSGGQSRLVVPNAMFAVWPLTSQGSPAFAPLSHIPFCSPSFAAASPRHRGHGSETVGPL
jgi:hypothetical protein